MIPVVLYTVLALYLGWYFSSNLGLKTMHAIVFPIFIFIPYSFNVVTLNSIPSITFSFLCFTTLMVLVLYGQKITYRWNLVDLGLFVFIGWATVATLIDDDIGYATLTLIDKYVGDFIPYFLIRALVPREQVARSMFLLAGLITILALTAPFEFVFNLRYSELLQAIWPTYGMWTPFYRGGFSRFFGSFGHPIAMGIGLSMAVFFTFVIHQLKILRDKRLAWVMMLICAAAIYMTISRTSYLLVVPILLVIYFAKVKRRLIYGLSLIVLFGLVLAVAIPVMDSYAAAGATAGADETQTSAAYRATLFNNYVGEIASRPILGHGFYLPLVGNQTSIDNYYLYLLLRYGIPGLVFFALPFLWGVYKGGLRFFIKETPRAEQIVIWGVISCILYYSIVSETVWLTSQDRTLLYMLLGYLGVLSDPPARHQTTLVARWL